MIDEKAGAGFAVDAEAEADPEKGGAGEKRPVRLFAPVYNGLATAFSIYFVGTGINKLLTAFLLDHSFTRFALAVTLPLLFCISLFWLREGWLTSRECCGRLVSSERWAWRSAVSRVWGRWE